MMTDFTIDNRSLAERVADKMEQMIQEEQMMPRDKIPNEYELAQKLSVGRSTVRESIKLLVSKNVLEIRRGAGTFVCRNLGLIDDPLGLRFESDRRKVALDLAKIRLLLEPTMAYEAAQRAKPEDIEELRCLNQQIDHLLEQKIDYAAPDSQFHVKICSISGNVVMPKLIPVVFAGIHYYTDITKSQSPNNSSNGHLKLIEAIQNHDAQTAYNIMFEHINSGIVTMQGV